MPGVCIYDTDCIDGLDASNAVDVTLSMFSKSSMAKVKAVDNS